MEQQQLVTKQQMTRKWEAQAQPGRTASGDAQTHPPALAVMYGSHQEAPASHHITCPTHPIYEGGQAEIQRRWRARGHAAIRTVRPSPGVSTPLDLPWARSSWAQGSLWPMSPKPMHPRLFSLLFSWSCIIARIQHVAHCELESLKKKNKTKKTLSIKGVMHWMLVFSHQKIHMLKSYPWVWWYQDVGPLGGNQMMRMVPSWMESAL